MRALNPIRLNYFHEVIQRGSFRAAAEELNTAPSVIMRQIRILETETGVQLFERTSTGVIPTEAARLVLDYRQGCAHQLEHLSDRLDKLRGLQQGSVRIAIGEGFATAFMDEVVNEFSERFPGIDITVVIASANEVLREVAEDVAHIGLTFNPPASDRVRCVERLVRPVFALMSPTHQLAEERGPLEFSVAAQHPLALLPPSYGLRQLVDSALSSENIAVTPMFSTSSLVMILKFVTAGRAITFASDFIARDEIATGAIVARPVSHPLFIATEARLLVRSGRPLPRAAAAFLTLIQQRMARVS